MNERASVLDRALSYRDLEALGEGSRWTIDRKVRDGRFPPPDYRDGRFPRWYESTIQRHRNARIGRSA